jgi:uncharacterized protein (TIGR03435 family)
MQSCVLCLLLILLLTSVMAARQQFDIATVKLMPPAEPGVLVNVNLGRINNGTVTLTNVTLSECLQFAYGIVSSAQIAGPDWIKTRDARFDIVAKAPPDAARDQVLVMLQNLLAERLKLATHHEKRETPFVALVVARNGPKLGPAKELPASGQIPAQGPGRILHPQMPMSMLATLLSRFEQQLIIDMTELKGPFAVDLQWLPDTLRRRASQEPALVNGQPVNLDLPSLPTALQEQLGLRLDSRKGPVDVLVVDHAEKVPVDN